LVALTDEDEVLWIEPSARLVHHSFDALMVEYTPGPPVDYATTLGSGVIVAVLDTGLDYLHRSFYDPNNPTPRLANILPSNHSKVASYLTADYPNTDFSWANGAHGTFVSGAVAGYFVSVNGETGVAPQARIAFYDMSKGTGELLDVIPSGFHQYLLDVCDQGGASVINISWGSEDTTGVYDEYSYIIDEVARDRPYCSITVACGNAGPGGICSSPSNAKSADSVGASFSRPEAYTSWWSDPYVHPERYQHTVAASFSSTGPLPDGRRAPLFFMPGVYEYLPYSIQTPTANHIHFAAISGTSFSSPNLAALKAEIVRRFMALTNGTRPTADLIRAILIAYSEPMSGDVMTVYSNIGAVPLANHPAIMAWGFPRLPTSGLDGLWVYGSVQSASSRRGYCALITNTSLPVTIGLSWSDIASPSLINDLDVRVFYDGLAQYPMWFDGVNPNERVIFQPNVSTNIRVVVYEKDGVVQQTTQPFSMYWTNVASVWECGTCFGFDQQSCSPSGYQLCNVTDGTFLPTCYPTVNTTCPTGYHNISNTCQCQPGTEVACPGTTDQVKQCNSDGLTYSSCYSKFQTAETSLKSVQNQPAATAGAVSLRGPSTVAVVTILFVLILVL
jgi:subtilisin family serine protease